MKVTLRKASALQNAIQEAIRNIEVKLAIQLNEFEDPAVVLDKATSEAVINDQRRASLTACLYDIRSLVGTANAASGINDRLAKAAYIDKRLGQLAGMVKDEVLRENVSVIQGKLEKLRTAEPKTRIYGYGDTVASGVLVAEHVAKYKADVLELKKAKQKLNDEILELNVRTEIDLPTEVEMVLNQEGLV